MSHNNSCDSWYGRGTDNLRCYILEAVLPPMINGSGAPAIPPKGHKSHLNLLKVRPERSRRLESMQCLEEDTFSKYVISWIESNIPAQSLGVEDHDDATGESLSVPSPYFRIPETRLNRPTNIYRLSTWLDNLPMATVQRALHLVFPELRDFSFTLNDGSDVDGNIFNHFFWTRTSDDLSDVGLCQGSVVVVFQPNWILSPQDLESFVRCKSFPPFPEEGIDIIQTQLQSKERLWGKLWDLCYKRNCPWFVVSTYQGWVFGTFSREWTTAFVTPVYEFDSYHPSVVGCLLYWLASAKGIAGGWNIPKVGEAILDMGASFSMPPNRGFRIAMPAPSESSWGGKSDPPGSSAGIDGMFSPVLSDTGLPDRTRPFYMPPPNINQRINLWVESANAFPETPQIFQREVSPTPSDSSASSIDTIKGWPGSRTLPSIGHWVA